MSEQQRQQPIMLPERALQLLDKPHRGLSEEYYQKTITNLRMIHIGGLPSELIMYIITYLSPKDIINFSMINRTMFYFIRNTSNLRKIISILSTHTIQWSFLTLDLYHSPMDAFHEFLKVYKLLDLRRDKLLYLSEMNFNVITKLKMSSVNFNNDNIIDIMDTMLSNQIDYLEITDIIIRLHALSIDAIFAYYASVLLRPAQIEEMIRLKSTNMTDIDCLIQAGIYTDLAEGPLPAIFSHTSLIRILLIIGFSPKFTFETIYNDIDYEELTEEITIINQKHALCRTLLRNLHPVIPEIVCYNLAIHFNIHDLPDIMRIINADIFNINSVCDILLYILHNENSIDYLRDYNEIYNTYITKITYLKNINFDEDFIIRALFTPTITDTKLQYIIGLKQYTNIHEQYIIQLITYINDDVNYMHIINLFLNGYTDWSTYCIIMQSIQSLI